MEQIVPAPVSPTGYALAQYQAFVDGALRVSVEANRTYLQAATEFWFAPHKLMARNARFAREVLTPPRPAWQTPHRYVALPARLSRLIRLLDFSQTPGADKLVVPTLILPPQAGHHSYIVDYSPQQSQVQTLRRAGLESIYSIEWLSATRETRDTSIEDYILALRFCVAKLGGKVNLIGDCQGGWLAAIYAALYPESVNTLAVAGAPIDFQAGDGGIKQAVNYNAQTYPDRGMAFYRGLVAAGNGILDGRYLILGFNVMRPSQVPERFLDLYRNIDDEDKLLRFQEMKNWYDAPQDLPGAFYLWLVAHLFRDNELIRGKLRVGDETVDLRRITCPLFLLAGTRDHVTPQEQVFEMARYVGTPQDRIARYVVDAGHIGLFMGRSVLNRNWAEVGRTIEALSER